MRPALDWHSFQAHAQPLGPNRKDRWERRKIEVKGWVTKAWSKRQITGLNDDKVKELLGQHADFMIEDANACIDWTHSKENQGPWLKKTMVSLWSIPGTTSKRRKIMTPERKRDCCHLPLHARLPMIIALQEIKSWDVEKVSLSGFFFFLIRNRFGYTTMIVPDLICNVQNGDPTKCCKQCFLDL